MADSGEWTGNEGKTGLQAGRAADSLCAPDVLTPSDSDSDREQAPDGSGKDWRCVGNSRFQRDGIQAGK